MRHDRLFSEKRYSRRFPLRLPVAVAGELSAHCSQTCDVSAGGVLFYMDAAVEVGAALCFALSMPAADLGSPRDVLVNCTGRVARCSEENGRFLVAVVIDEYQFERTEGAPPAST